MESAFGGRSGEGGARRGRRSAALEAGSGGGRRRGGGGGSFGEEWSVRHGGWRGGGERKKTARSKERSVSSGVGTH